MTGETTTADNGGASIDLGPLRPHEIESVRENAGFIGGSLEALARFLAMPLWAIPPAAKVAAGIPT